MQKKLKKQKIMAWNDKPCDVYKYEQQREVANKDRSVVKKQKVIPVGVKSKSKNKNKKNLSGLTFLNFLECHPQARPSRFAFAGSAPILSRRF
ncbi:hypothetical protein QTO34_017933 [Cnephaeus nilssonii]|uniref:Uncharacterized protein n=1 Tax=Cnephaeus nilssonii TaxID=3371016 RepID=A0AA40LRQ2_CNENI|nr:hypothetical protein QTO34_017933 [Eptesicus nilssonii]